MRLTHTSMVPNIVPSMHPICSWHVETPLISGHHNFILFSLAYSLVLPAKRIAAGQDGRRGGGALLMKRRGIAGGRNWRRLPKCRTKAGGCDGLKMGRGGRQTREAEFQFISSVRSLPVDPWHLFIPSYPRPVGPSSPQQSITQLRPTRYVGCYS
jgi:hypothetical protein